MRSEIMNTGRTQEGIVDVIQTVWWKRLVEEVSVQVIPANRMNHVMESKRSCQMKKAIALVGAGALVVTLGLGPGYTQQTGAPPAATPPATVQPKAAPAGDVTKDQLLPSKPTTSTGTETAAKPAGDKPVEKGAPVKPEGGLKADKAATMEKSGDVKPESAAKEEKTPAGPAGKESNKPLLEQAPAAKTGQTAVSEKPSVEKPSDNKDLLKPAVKE